MNVANVFVALHCGHFIVNRFVLWNTMATHLCRQDRQSTSTKYLEFVLEATSGIFLVAE